MRWRTDLATRLTAFALGALALVLVGFSATIYLVERSAASRRADARLDAALDTLTASVEFDPGGFEWEPSQRRVAVGQGSGVDEVRWTVRDDAGRVVDLSPNLASARLLDRLSGPVGPGTRVDARVRLDGRDWRVVRRQLGPVARSAPAAPKAPFYPSLTLAVALCLDPVDAAVRQLGRLLAAVSVVVWLAAAASMRGFCRRALRPLARMAEAARVMGAGDPDVRLPDPGTGDELDALAADFNGLLDRLHEAFARQARFAGDASHQLRTPLAVMLGQVDVALRRDRPADEYRRTLALVRDQAARLNRIVEMLLFLARADADARHPDRQTVDLTAWAREHLASWAAHPRAADIALDAPPTRLPVRVQPPLLGQLLDNLVDNACKYSEAGTPVVVGVSPSASGSARLSVRDHGPGITPEDLPHLFDPFFRSPRARLLGRPGVGLGLTIARRIAASFDGRITALSPAEGGSEFALTLPLAVETPDPHRPAGGEAAGHAPREESSQLLPR